MAIFGHKDDQNLSLLTVAYQVDLNDHADIVDFFLRGIFIELKESPFDNEFTKKEKALRRESYISQRGALIESIARGLSEERSPVGYPYEVLTDVIAFCELNKSIIDCAYYEKSFFTSDLIKLNKMIFFYKSDLEVFYHCIEAMEKEMGSELIPIVGAGNMVLLISEGSVSISERLLMRRLCIELYTLVEIILKQTKGIMAGLPGRTKLVAVVRGRNDPPQDSSVFENVEGDTELEDIEPLLSIPLAECDECGNIYLVKGRRKDNYCSYRCSHRVKSRNHYASLFPEGKTPKKPSEKKE